MRGSIIQKIGFLLERLIAPLYLAIVEIIKLNRLNKIIAGALLFALLPLPYSYYQLLRIFVTIVAITFANKYYKLGQINKSIAFGVIALVWNPVLPIHFDKNLWMILDIVGAAIFYFVGSEDKI